MKILVCDPVSPKGIALLQQRPEFKVVVLPKRHSEEELLPLVEDVVAMVVRSETKVTRKVIEAAVSLRDQPSPRRVTRLLKCRTVRFDRSTKLVQILSRFGAPALT